MFHAGVNACYGDIPFCTTYNTEGNACAVCEDGYSVSRGNCVTSVAHCSEYAEAPPNACTACVGSYELIENQGDCYVPITNCFMYDTTEANEDYCLYCLDTYRKSENEQHCYTTIPECSDYDEALCVECNEGKRLAADGTACFDFVD
jgi:hypothetical protein